MWSLVRIRQAKTNRASMKKIVIVITLLVAVCQVAFAQQTKAQVESAQQAKAQVESTQQTRAQKESARQAKAQQAKAQKESAQQDKAQQAKAQKESAQQAKAQQAKAQKESAQQAKAQKESAQQAKAQRESAQQARAQKAQAQKEFVQQARAQQAKAKKESAQQAKAKKESAQQAKAKKESAQQAKAQKDSTRQTKAQQDSTRQTKAQAESPQRAKAQKKSAQRAQKWAVSTSVLDIVNFGTINFQGERILSRNWTAVAGFRYNPWEWKDTEGKAMHNKARTLNLGVCFWPWRNYSGWWVSVKGQIEEYNVGNVLGFKKDYEGYAYGGNLSVGYALMIGRHLNLTFGLGAWAGWTDYTLYTHPTYGRILDKGGKFFVSPSNETKIGLMYIF